MRKRKKIKLSYSKERVLFSDVLPYECPIIFSNRYLYRFLAKYLWVGKVNGGEIQLKQNKRTGEKDASAFAALLFGCYEKGKGIGQYNIDLMLYSTPINLISLTRKIKTERCLLYIHIISGKLLSFMISISILCSIFVIRAHTLFASHIR